MSSQQQEKRETVYVTVNRSSEHYHTDPECTYGGDRMIPKDKSLIPGRKMCSKCAGNDEFTKNGPQPDKTCPMCGEERVANMATHLRHKCEATQ